MFYNHKQNVANRNRVTYKSVNKETFIVDEECKVSKQCRCHPSSSSEGSRPITFLYATHLEAVTDGSTGHRVMNKSITLAQKENKIHSNTKTNTIRKLEIRKVHCIVLHKRPKG